MNARRRLFSFGILAVLLGASAFSVPLSRPAAAVDGTTLRSFVADLGPCSVGTGLAFDGSRLLTSCWYDKQIRAVSPIDGHRLATYTVDGLGAGVSGVGALAYDRQRVALWACGTDSFVYLITLPSLVGPFVNPTAPAAVKFRAPGGCIDGLAYDGSDDSLFVSGDVASTVYHYSASGSLIEQLNVSGKLGSCGNSGIAVGGSVLLLANNGCSQIYRADKKVLSSTLFASYPARLEDLECDDVSFGANGKAAIWSKDAYDNVLNAFELDPGTCGFGGYPVGYGKSLIQVALGDSYSSGEGAFNFEDGTNYPGRFPLQENTLTFGANSNSCHRSLVNYAKVNNNPITATNLLEPTLPGKLFDVTCSGALISQEGDPHGVIVAKDLSGNLIRFESQISLSQVARSASPDAAKPVDLVTLTMGGNDAGFGDLILACVLPNILHEAVASYPDAPGTLEWISQNLRCSNLQFFSHVFGSNVDDKISALANKETLGHQLLLQSYPTARILQLTYPLPIPVGGSTYGETCGGMLADDVPFARSKGTKIDQAIRDSITTTRATPGGTRLEVVDVQDSFGSNGLCPSSPDTPLANSISQAGIRRGVDFMLDVNKPIRPAIDSLVSAIRSWQSCTKAAAWGGIIVGPGPLVLCQLKLNTVKDRGSALGSVLGDNAKLLTEKFVDNPGSKSPATLFDESRNFYHPNAKGFAVMACGVRAVYKAQNVATCNAANAGSTFLVNGGPITNRTPIRLVADPFGFWAPFTYTLTGWTPGSTVYTVARSEPIDLGSVTADATGSISANIQLPSTLSPGIHRVVFSGDAPGGAARNVQMYVDVPGRPLSGTDYSVYLAGLAPNETAAVSYGGIDLGEYTVNADGGLWLTLPVGVISTVNDAFIVTATGTTSNRSVTRRFFPVPVRTAGGIWATGTTTDAVSIDGNNADLGSLVHSDGGILVTGNNDAGANAEHVSGLTMPGNHSQFTNVRVATPDGNPYGFDLASWKPGARLAVAAGTSYRSVDPSACTAGTWKPNAADLTAGAILYVPCNVSITAATNTVITSTFLSSGDITLAANKVTIRPAALGAGVSFAATNATLEGENLTIQGAVQASGSVTIRGNNATTSCLVVGTQVKITGNKFTAPNMTCPA